MVAVAKRKRERTGFGPRLRSLREAKGLTQADLAEIAGKTYQEISHLEREVRQPNWPTVLKLADALGVSLDAFRDGDDPDPEDGDADEDEPTYRPSKRK